MSKIGRKPIDIGNVKVEIKDNQVHYKGPKGSGVYQVPSLLTVTLNNNQVNLQAEDPSSPDARRLWGLHRALLANAIKGASTGFEKQLVIEGLGFKAALSGSKVVFNLGFSHKIDYVLPKEVTMEVDKTGQKLTFKSSDKELLGHVCSQIRALRPPEPYKGTGIRGATEVIARKAGKTKAA